MSIQNLAIVFGQTLFGQISSNGSISGHGNGSMADAAFQNKVGIHAFVFFSGYFFMGVPLGLYTLQGHRDDSRTLHRYIRGRVGRRGMNAPGTFFSRLSLRSFFSFFFQR